VVYGDVLTDLDLSDLRAAHHLNAAREPGLGATLALHRVANPTEKGLVGLTERDRVSRFVEKPAAENVFTDLASAGVLILEPRALPFIPEDRQSDLGHDLFPALLAAGVPLYGWVMPEDSYLVDIGTPESYARAQREWPLWQQRRRRLAQAGTAAA
jgi:NDP-sugar pyrophosphorylase family protein